MMFRFLLVFLLLASGASAQTVFDSVIAEVEKAQRESGMRTASIGFCIIPLHAPDSSAAAGYRMDTGLVPASTMKAICTATAVDVLGPDYRFKTMLQYSGDIDESGDAEGRCHCSGRW